MKEIMTNITLSEKEDRILKIQDAQAGTSKRKLATEITKRWLEEQDVKAWIESVLTQISRMPNNDRYFDAVETLGDNCIMLTEYNVKEEINKIFGKGVSQDNREEIKEKILESFKVLREITDVPEFDPDLFSSALSNSYFTQRTR
ncbi:MAG: hypothetical protein GX813_05075 [Erysipelotrichia bacterium]|nr:hypothetical protein [Erysipelotrichia bacterium]